MKLTVKTLQQKTFTIESDQDDTVLDLKDKIKKIQGYEIELQKLIHSGKILNDQQVVKDLNIQEKDFLVVMVTKPKIQSTSNTTQDKAPAATAPVPAPVAPAPAPAPVAPAPVAASGNTNTGSVGDGIATGSAYEEAVKGLVEMGFERSQVTRAMRAAFNNPDRAAEYLMTGIPEGILQENSNSQPSAGAQVAQPVQETGGNVPFNMFDAAASQARNAQGNNQSAQGNTQSAAAQLSMLRNSSQFQQLRQLVQAQPELLQPLLQQLAQSSPEMMQLLSSNQEEFLSLLGEGAEAGEFGDDESGAAGGGQFITISPEDDAAINRVI